METLKNALVKLVGNNTRFYSELAEVVRTYRVKDVNERGEVYSPIKHLTCDVRIVSNATIVYGVKLSPAFWQAGNTVFDGTTESKSGDIRVDVPLVGSYVLISWTDEENAFVVMNSRTESLVIGSTSGAYIDFYVQDESRIMELVNTDEFRIELPSGRSFVIKNDTSANTSEILAILNKVNFKVDKANLLFSDAGMNFEITDDGKIEIKNNTESLRDILYDMTEFYINYLNGVSVGLAAAVPPVNVAPVISNLQLLKNRIDKLLK